MSWKTKLVCIVMNHNKVCLAENNVDIFGKNVNPYCEYYLICKSNTHSVVSNGVQDFILSNKFIISEDLFCKMSPF